jgi:hypothetical protein
MRRVPLVILLGLVGYVVGYYAGASYACSGADPSNLCGLVGVFLTGPVCLLIGILLGLKFGRTP